MNNIGMHMGNDESILRPLKLCEFWRPQNGPGFDDREESHIASIRSTKDRRKMDRYDGRQNSHNLSGRSIKTIFEKKQNGQGKKQQKNRLLFNIIS